MISEQNKVWPDYSSIKTSVIEMKNIFWPRKHVDMFATITVKNEFIKPKVSNPSSEEVTMNNHISRTFSDTGSESEIGRKACLKTNILYLQHPPNKSKVQGAPSLDFPKDHLAPHQSHRIVKGSSAIPCFFLFSKVNIPVFHLFPSLLFLDTL